MLDEILTGARTRVAFKQRNGLFFNARQGHRQRSFGQWGYSRFVYYIDHLDAEVHK